MNNKTKTRTLSLADKVVKYFSPGKYNSRLQEQLKTDLFLRQYDAAQTHSYAPVKRSNKSANNEVGNAVAPIRNSARDLIRNAPFAKKGLDVIVNGVVGYGISANITHPDPTKEEKIKGLWKEWSEGLCSIDGRTDFYTLQNQVMTAVVCDGEVLVKELSLDNSIRLQILESDYINTTKAKNVPEGSSFVNGVVQDKYGRPLSFNLFEKHPGDSGKSNSELVPATQIMHVFRQDRPEQNRGVSWFANVAGPLSHLNELQYTQLIRMKLAASITAVVTTEPSQLPPELLQQQREDEWTLGPGDVRYINPGENIEFPTISNPEGFEGTTKLSLREIAAGLGITYEALSNDLSQVNFSSGRMGDLQFRANVDQWRWHMLIPRFCNPAFERFKKYCALKGVSPEGVKVEWTPPARQMIDPSSEVSSTKDAIRAGLQTLPAAIRELGLDPETHLKEIAKSNELLDSLGLVFDSDPRRTGNQQLQSSDSYQAIKNDQATPKA